MLLKTYLTLYKFSSFSTQKFSVHNPRLKVLEFEVEAIRGLGEEGRSVHTDAFSFENGYFSMSLASRPHQNGWKRMRFQMKTNQFQKTLKSGDIWKDRSPVQVIAWSVGDFFLVNRDLTFFLFMNRDWR